MYLLILLMLLLLVCFQPVYMPIVDALPSGNFHVWSKKSKERLVGSQTACQGILVGVYIEVSQYEGFLLAAILKS